ncbi:NAC domain-containing protein 72-like [Vitis riparia]|uniref:NAC domain-containing protein 72-like n=1 Tax=Vitis riparia TaxID=96939 RepID=UPI00155A43A3|nr:NAC domain-containing protein 72-like [Vitis riparia]
MEANQNQFVHWNHQDERMEMNYFGAMEMNLGATEMNQNQMFQLDVNERWYFFTPRDRKYPNGNRPNRTAGDGFWKASARDHTITMDNNETIGYKKSLAYHEGKPKNGVKTNWLMKEYRLSKTELDMWVVCEIYKKSEKSEIVKPHHQHNTVVDDGGQGFLSDYGDQRL